MIGRLRAWLNSRIHITPHFTEFFCLALLVFQPIWFYWRTVIGLRGHIPFDIEGYHLPQIGYLAQCLRDRSLPLWDPYQYAGMPIHADMQAQLFYPPTWIVILLGNLSHERYLYYLLEWMNPAHMILAGVALFVLLRRMGLRVQTALLGASVYQLGSFFASQAQHLGAICTAGWLPLAALSVFELRHTFRIRWLAVFAVSIAMSILAGFPAATLVIAAAIVFFALALIWFRDASWRIAGPIAAGFLWGALIAAAVLIPAWTLTQLSMASQRSLWSGTGGGLPLAALVSLFNPNHYHIFDLANYKRQDNFTFLYIYCGIVPILLIALAPFLPRAKAAVFFVITVLMTVWMLGDQTPIGAFIFPRVPHLIRGALYPEFVLIAFAFFGGITAAFQLDRFAPRLPQALLWILVLFTSWDLVHTGSKRPMNTYNGGPRLGDDRGDLIGQETGRQAFGELVDQTSPPSRIDYMDTAFGAGQHAAGVMRLPTPDGDNPFMLLRVRRLRHLYAEGDDYQRLTSVTSPGSPLLSMLNVSYLESVKLLSKETTAAAGLEFVSFVNGVNIYRNPHVLPRFFLVPTVRHSPGENETFRLLGDPSFNPSKEAIVEGIPADRPHLSVAPVHVDSFTKNRIELTVTTTGPAFLVSSEVMYPGWAASVNNFQVGILMTNGTFRGIPLAAGQNRIVMEYRPIRQLAGIFVSLSFGIPALLLIASPRRFAFWAIRQDRPYPKPVPVPLDPRRLTKEAIALAPLACFLAIAGYGIFGSIPIGLANNGDFPRILGAFRLWTAHEVEHKSIDLFRYFVNDYVFSDPLYASGVPSSETIPATFADYAAKIFLPPGTFKLQLLGLEHMLLFALAIFIFLRALRRRAWWLRLLCGFALVLIWSDLEYVQQFNTAYTDAGAIGALAICYAIAVYCLLNESSWRWAAGFALSGCFLAATKTQHETALLALIPCALLFAFRAGRRLDRAAWLAVSVLLLATAAWIVTSTPRDYRTPPAFTVVFSKIVRLAPDAKAVLADFHMPEGEFLRYIGHYWYEPVVPNGDKAFKDRILDLVSPRTLASYYLRHPAVTARILLADLHESGADITLANYGNRSEENIAAGREPFELTLWSGFRHVLFRFAPDHLILVFLAAIAFCTVCMAKPGFGKSWLAWPLVFFGVLLAIPSYLFASLLDAAETARHLVFFQMSTDLMLFSAVLMTSLHFESKMAPKPRVKLPARAMVYTAAAAVILIGAIAFWLSSRSSHVFDDTSAEIHYTGSWQHGLFADAANGTTSFSSQPHAKATFSFSGTAVTWVYAQAWNRGIASVRIDGIARSEVDQYSSSVVWGVRTTFAGLAPGRHTLEIEVTGKKGPAAQENWVDLDELIVR